MINFIIGGNYNTIKEIKNEINNYMMNYDIEVRYHLFESNKEFEKGIDSITGFKVYIIDINKTESDYIYKVDYIRNILDDWSSIILLITEDKFIKYELLGNRLFLFDIIVKDESYKIELRQDLKHVIKNYDNRDKCLTIETNRIIKKIDFKCIEVITKEKDSKKCIIKSSHGNYYTPESLKTVNKRLDNRFVKTSRSCIINMDKVKEFNPNENKIVFKNGKELYDISRDNKKEIIKSFLS